MPRPPQLLLASTSKNRQELLTTAGIPFKAIPSHVDEAQVLTRIPSERVVTLAVKKAEAVAESEKYAVVLAADTIGLFRGEIMEKPKFKMDALQRLKQLANNVHVMLTGYAIINCRTGKRHQGLSETVVYFRHIDEDELTAYVNDFPVIQWAAGYSPLNTPAIHFVKKVEGSLTGFSHGLPLEEVVPILREEKVI